MMATTDSIAVEVRKIYGSQGLKITRSDQRVYVDLGSFFLLFIPEAGLVNISIGWQVLDDCVFSKPVLASLSELKPTVNNEVTKLIENLTAFIQPCNEP